jgi:transcriptional regulator with XRE-family HTH domain
MEKEDINLRVGKIVRALRKHRDMTMEVLGARCGRSKAAHFEIEKGMSAVSVPGLIKIAEALSVPADVLVRATIKEDEDEAIANVISIASRVSKVRRSVARRAVRVRKRNRTHNHHGEFSHA